MAVIKSEIVPDSTWPRHNTSGLELNNSGTNLDEVEFLSFIDWASVFTVPNP